MPLTKRELEHMESHGAQGAVQITRATYELIKDDFECTPRGTVAVKGKGDMEVWHVMRERVAASTVAQGSRLPA